MKKRPRKKKYRKPTWKSNLQRLFPAAILAACVICAAVGICVSLARTQTAAEQESAAQSGETAWENRPEDTSGSYADAAGVSSKTPENTAAIAERETEADEAQHETDAAEPSSDAPESQSDVPESQSDAPESQTNAAESQIDTAAPNPDAALAKSDLQTQEESAIQSQDSEKPEEFAKAPSDAALMPQEASNQINVSMLAAGTVLSAAQVDLGDLSPYFAAASIEPGDAVYNRINGRSWQENDHIALSDLRYLKLLHYNFRGQIQVGELIVNKSIAEDVLGIFRELFACGYQIQSMYLIDNYWTGDPDDSDTASVEVNNSSAFCYRPATNGTSLSRHAYGLAIDINPQQNPYVSYSSGAPKWYHENANDYIARDTGLPHVITHEDTAFLIFQKYGFSWGGDWTNPKDYQHFEKK